MSTPIKNALAVPTPPPPPPPPVVIRVLDRMSVVINRGAAHGFKKGDRFLVFRIDDEPLQDPTTGEDLGHLELVVGTGAVTHIQDKVSTIRSTMTKGQQTNALLRVANPFAAEDLTEIPFNSPLVGDWVRPV